MAYLKVLEEHIPLNNDYKDVMAFWNVKCINEDNTEKDLNNVSRSDFFSSYDINFNNISTYIHLNFPIKYGLTTSVRLTRTMLGSQMDNLSSSNYVHIVDELGKEHFYFITDIDYSVGKDIVKLNLERDIFTEFSPSLYIDKDIKYARVHCDRYSQTTGNGCDEMFTSDPIDAKYKASILNSRKKIFDNGEKMWAVVYLSNNTPQLINYQVNSLGSLHYRPNIVSWEQNDSDLYLCYSAISNNSINTWYYDFLSLNEDTDPSIYDKDIKYTNIKGYNQPYITCVIPLFDTFFTLKVTLQGNNTMGATKTTYTKLFNYKFNKEQFLNFINNNDYVYKVQVTTFDFTSQLVNANNEIDLTTTKICALSTKLKTLKVKPCYTDKIGSYNYNQLSTTLNINVFNGFLFCLPNFDDIVQNQDISFIKLATMTNFVYDITDISSLKEGQRSLDDKQLALEPRLYCNPYTIYSYTSASEKEYELNPNLFCYYGDGRFTLTFTPSPSMNGEILFLNSGVYQKYKENFNGTSPISSLELTTSSSAYQSFLTNQRNSYYTGLGQSYFNSIMNMFTGGVNDYKYIMNARENGTDTFSAYLSPISNVVKGVSDLVFTSLQNKSKMKDLINQPSKFSNFGFDILPMIVNSDLYRYINCYTMLPRDYTNAFEYFYRFGYEVDEYRHFDYYIDDIRDPKEWYIKYGGSKNIFNRNLFNYVRATEDISNYIHLVNDKMDEAIRSKFSDIFNNGVRIWTPKTSSQFLDFTKSNREVYF